MKKIKCILAILIFLCSASVYAQSGPVGAVQEKIAKGEISFKGGGLTIEDAIQMPGTATNMECVQSEHAYLAKVYGPRGTTWTTTKYSSATNLTKKDGKIYDRLEVVFPDGRPSLNYYFDITHCFGKYK